jgi:alpha-tubulin suppressor-like RCC1 family protein
MKTRFLDVRAWVVLLVCLNSTACFHSLDDTKVRCTSSDHCPDNFVCSGGKCVSRSASAIDGGPIDTGLVDIKDSAVPGEVGSGSETAGTKPDIGATGPETAVITPVDAAIEAGPESPTGPDALPTDSILPPSDREPDHPVAPDMGPEVGPDVPYVPEVGPDLPLTGCVISGTSYAGAAANPSNSCQVCKPATSSSAWSNADEGTSCGSGQYCNSGTCKAGCFISGTYYANAAANPANACQICQTTFAATAWTASANGATCGTGQVCSGGTCQSGCWIDGALVISGTTNAANVCQICKPTASTSGWSNNTDGTNCGTGKICGAGICQAGCYVGSTVYPTGTLNPANSCQSCSPAISSTAWYQVPSDCATIAAHNGFTCATVGGVAKCWGNNWDGNLGIGQSHDQTPSSAVPLAVTGLGIGVQSVSTGATSTHACALVAGGVSCWGPNDFGDLGDGTTSGRNAPVQVVVLQSGVLGVATGDYHSCALLSGQVQCWGYNLHGQLGISASQGSTTPVMVTLSGNIQAIAVGGNHSCALIDGSVWCWGDNSFGQLGNNSTTGNYLPVQAVGLGSNVQAIAAGGAHTCAIANGSLLCWGYNRDGELGDGTTTDRWAPVPVQGLSSGVQAVTAGELHACAVVNGGAWCWGTNVYGQLGDNSTTDRWSPVAVQQLGSGVQAITASSAHSCALASAGAKCWGRNSNGELGNNSTTDSSIPVSVQGL